MREVKVERRVCLFIRDAITNCHSLSGLKTEITFPTVREAQRARYQQEWLLQGLSRWL